MGNSQQNSVASKTAHAKVQTFTRGKSPVERQKYRQNVLSILQDVLSLKGDLFRDCSRGLSQIDTEEKCKIASYMVKNACTEIQNLHKLLVDVHLGKKGAENAVAKSIKPAVDHCYNAMGFLAKISMIPSVTLKDREKISDYIAKIPDIICRINHTQQKPDSDVSDFNIYLQTCAERALYLLECSLTNSKVLSQSPYIKFTMDSVRRAYALVKLVDHGVALHNFNSMIYLATYNVKMLSLAFEVELNRGFKVSQNGMPLIESSPYHHSVAAIATKFFMSTLDKNYILQKPHTKNEPVCDSLMTCVYLFEGTMLVRQAFAAGKKDLPLATSFILCGIIDLFEDAMQNCDKLLQYASTDIDAETKQELLKKLEHISMKISNFYSHQAYSLPNSVLFPLDKAVITTQRLMDRLDRSRVLYDHNWGKDSALPLFPSESLPGRKVVKSGEFSSIVALHKTHKKNLRKPPRDSHAFLSFIRRKTNSASISRSAASTSPMHCEKRREVPRGIISTQKQKINSLSPPITKLSPLAQMVSQNVSVATIEALHMYVYSQSAMAGTDLGKNVISDFSSSQICNSGIVCSGGVLKVKKPAVSENVISYTASSYSSTHDSRETTSYGSFATPGMKPLSSITPGKVVILSPPSKHIADRIRDAQNSKTCRTVSATSRKDSAGFHVSNDRDFDTDIEFPMSMPLINSTKYMRLLSEAQNFGKTMAKSNFQIPTDESDSKNNPFLSIKSEGTQPLSTYVESCVAKVISPPVASMPMSNKSVSLPPSILRTSRQPFTPGFSLTKEPFHVREKATSFVISVEPEYERVSNKNTSPANGQGSSKIEATRVANGSCTGKKTVRFRIDSDTHEHSNKNTSSTNGQGSSKIEATRVANGSCTGKKTVRFRIDSDTHEHSNKNTSSTNGQGSSKIEATRVANGSCTGKKTVRFRIDSDTHEHSNKNTSPANGQGSSKIEALEAITRSGMQGRKAYRSHIVKTSYITETKETPGTFSGAQKARTLFRARHKGLSDLSTATNVLTDITTVCGNEKQVFATGIQI